ncbi:M23 family metallopeptidase [Arthrobacter jiangjiafuii]|uniref:M23 family metallopeptidase n=1 Tax=Arthrobacter jiangjiafuii TaxID=2817475 RepID=A0A975M856_9MICC|nr:M23 family metallopeptidase [Arthrobacter jiangjiafuii]MBP3043015.1 peptidoglycan DD-metalloendopeptidase family protein [Arthrobacter jiangjiafuii]QWC11535.1 M23 family metallopeptidase [Arthrobacter jiangjiafuii]
MTNNADRTVAVSLPFTGKWKVENSPLRRVPSHGTHLLATTYAIDFVGVDDDGRTAPRVSWRTAFATEAPELFFAFGRPILAPVTGKVVAVHDGEPDHEARRSQLALVPYLLGQQERLRQGTGAIAGNHILIAADDGGAVVGVMHLRAGSLRVGAGRHVSEGEHIGDCGNSGNSTQPHVHVQAMDGRDPWTARGLPLVFRSFGEKPARGSTFITRANMLPQEGSIVEAQ